mmetsp:Transcript_25139/g.27961  ORF Transcript_25139/g.27961 Transcript_25139/m.27961 type:complete len:205 (+) Transcript_25139:69-683(+)
MSRSNDDKEYLDRIERLEDILEAQKGVLKKLKAKKASAKSLNNYPGKKTIFPVHVFNDIPLLDFVSTMFHTDIDKSVGVEKQKKALNAIICSLLQSGENLKQNQRPVLVVCLMQQTQLICKTAYYSGTKLKQSRKNDCLIALSIAKHCVKECTVIPETEKSTIFQPLFSQLSDNVTLASADFIERCDPPHVMSMTQNIKILKQV